MPKFLTDLQKIDLDLVWTKMVRQAGLKDGPEFQLSGLLDQTITSKAVSYFVDAVNGNDANDGLSLAAPLQTINEAINRIPFSIRHSTAIFLKAGTYAENLFLSHTIGPNNVSFNQELRIEGLDFVTPVLGSGSITAGIMGAAAGLPRTHLPSNNGVALLSYTVAGAAWTPHELKGMFLNVAGVLYPIADNTATTLEMTVEGSALNGKTFAIVTQGAIIAPPAGFAGISCLGMTPGRSSGGFHFKNLKILPGSFYGIDIDNGVVQLEGCYLSAGSQTAVLMIGHGAYLYVNRSFLLGATAGNAIQTGSQFGGGGLWFSGAVLDGNGGTGGANRLIYGQNSSIGEVQLFGHLLLQNGAFGMVFHNGPTFLQESGNSAGHIIIRNMSTHAINLTGACHWSGGPEIFNCSVGIRTRSIDEGATYGHISISLQNTTNITDISGDAISIGGTHTALAIRAPGVITGNTGVGIRLQSDVHGCFNSLTIESANANFTMGTNTGGDILQVYSGVADTLANFKIAGITANTTHFTRVEVS